MKKHLSLQGASVPGDASATVSSSDSISLGPHNLRPKPSLLPPPEVTRCFLTMADLNTSYLHLYAIASVICSYEYWAPFKVGSPQDIGN